MDFHTLIYENPYFSAGAGLIGVGAALTGLRQGARRLLYLIQRKFLTTVEVTSKDPAYHWIVTWLTRQALISGGHFTINALRLSRHGTAVSSLGLVGGNTLPVQLSPAPGVHYLRWQGTWIKVQREREKSALMDLTTGNPFETITLTTMGRKSNYFYSLLCEARGEVAKLEEGKLIIYTSWAAEWRPFGNPRQKRSLKSIVFAKGVKERLVEDVQEFLASGSWYAERGIPYRRGYLLYGPPGGGKSSFIQALASELDYSICLLNLSETTLTDDRLNHLLNALPDRSILLLEDIDGAMASHGRSSSNISSPSSGPSTNRLTISGLLNALDGVASAEERIIFMTTNHADRLDPALIRPGRVDIKQFIGKADKDQVIRMFSRFYPEHGHLAKSFAEAALVFDPAPAAIQGHFIRFKQNPTEAIDKINLLSAMNGENSSQ